MAGKKISQLTSGSLSNLNLGGLIPVVYSGITLQHNLGDLRNKLVDSGSHVFTGSQVINGDLTISGSIIAQQYVVSSSITNVVIQNVSGSSVFGNSNDDNHSFTGSVNITGSLTLDKLIVGPISENLSGSQYTAAHFATSNSINIAHFEGDNEFYSQLYVKNKNSSSYSSSDIVVTADNGTEMFHFVNLGINSSTYDFGYVGKENDAYLINSGKDLYIGTVGGPYHPSKLMLFAQNNWENPQITIHTGSQVTFNTSGFTEGYTYQFSGDVKLQDNLKVDGAVIIGSAAPITGPDVPQLHVKNSDNINITHFEGNNQHYAQVNITNIKSGSLASSDLSITADNGNETVHYVNLGINSSTYDGGFVGYENDAYLLNVGKDLYVGTVGGTNHPAKLMLFAQNNWVNPQMTIHTGSQITFNTSSFTDGYLYEFSGSVKLQDELKVDGSVTASYFVGDGSQLTNLPTQTIDTSSLATTGSNIFVGNQTITGSLSFGDSGLIQSISASSGDGGGYSTLTLTPDSSLGSDQYLILDPTGPNHIHIRPGGTIDNSSSDLYIGGEKNYLRVSDSGASVRMQTEDSAFINGYYFSIGNGYSTAEWYTENGNHYVRFNDPTIDVYNAIWAFNNPSTFSALYDGGTNYISFTVLGSSTPGFPAAPSFYVAEAPPSSPTYLNSVDIEIRQNRQTYVNLSNNDININASDDLRLYARDRFQLRNYSSDEPIEIVLDYDNTDKTFAFNPDGSLGFPDSTIQTTAFTGFPENLVSGSSQVSYTGITDVPTGIVSSSLQIEYSGLTGIPSGIISGSSQLPSELVSGSSQISYTGITDIPAGIVSGSSQIGNLGYAITGSNTFIGDQTINGSLIIEGVSEVLTVDGGFNGNRTFDYTSGSIFYLTGLTGNGVWNIENVPTTNNKVLALTYVVEQGVTAYSGSQYQINGSNVTVKWVDSTIPTGSANKTEVIGLTAFRVGSSWNVIGSLSTFGV